MITLRRTMGFAVFTTMIGAAWAAGCGDQKPATPPPQPDAGVYDAAPPVPTPTVPPAPVAGPCDAVQLAALSTVFPGRAGTEAPGMQAEGTPICNVVPEGQSAASQVIMFQQGYCYTILGASLPGVTELDMQVDAEPAAGIPLPPSLQAIKVPLMTDTTTGPMSALGAKQDCYHYTLPIPAAVRVTLKARTGSGPVAAQVYKKKKF